MWSKYGVLILVILLVALASYNVAQISGCIKRKAEEKTKQTAIDKPAKTITETIYRDKIKYVQVPGKTEYVPVETVREVVVRGEETRPVIPQNPVSEAGGNSYYISAMVESPVNHLDFTYGAGAGMFLAPWVSVGVEARKSGDAIHAGTRICIYF